MHKVLMLFDYIYYRIYRFSKERGDNTPETNGTLILSLIQCFTVIDIVVILQIMYSFPFPNKFIFFALIVILGVLNWYKYERNFNASELEARWKNEDERNRIKKGRIIGLLMLIIFLFPPIYGYLKHNLKLI